MGTSMAHPQSLQSLQQAAGGYQVRPYPTAPANLPDGLQGYYGPEAAPAAPYGPAPLAASAVKPVGPTEPFNPGQPMGAFQQPQQPQPSMAPSVAPSVAPSMAPDNGPLGGTQPQQTQLGIGRPLSDSSLGLLIGERPAGASDQDWQRYTDAVAAQRQNRLDGDLGRYIGTGEGPHKYEQFIGQSTAYGMLPGAPLGSRSPNLFQQTDNISSQLQGILDYSRPPSMAPSMAPYGPAPAAVSAVASSFRTPEQIQAQVNQAMYGQFNPFVQPTPNTVQQAQLPPAGLFADNPVDTTDLGQNFQTSVGQLQADEAANEAVLAKAPLDYEAAKKDFESTLYGGFIGKGEDQENQRWDTKKQGELPPTKPGWAWFQSDDEKDNKFRLQSVDEDSGGYRNSGTAFPEYDEWFKQNVVMPTPTYTPVDNQKMATDIFTRR
jgi:hypothetical protein